MRMCVPCAQSCLTLCNPMDYTPPGFSVHGIFQARILEWVAIFSSRGSSPSKMPELASLASPVLQSDSLLLSHWGVLSWAYNLSFKWLKWEWCCNNGNCKCSCKLHKLILKARNTFSSWVLFDLNDGGLLYHINSFGKNQYF